MAPRTRSMEPVIPIVSLGTGAVALAALSLWTWLPTESPTPDPLWLALTFAVLLSTMIPGLAVSFVAELRRRRAGPQLGIVEGAVFVATSLAGTGAQLYLALFLLHGAAALWLVAGLGALWGLACWILLGAGVPWKGWGRPEPTEDESR